MARWSVECCKGRSREDSERRPSAYGSTITTPQIFAICLNRENSSFNCVIPALTHRRIVENNSVVSKDEGEGGGLTFVSTDRVLSRNNLSGGTYFCCQDVRARESFETSGEFTNKWNLEYLHLFK